ncbi:MAG: hypothetical protein KC410_13775 [Anaerolineales bacterium]|nr:hypothetical protein [Anaerolineales bacterium]
MNTYHGWLLDIYPDDRGATLWLLGDDGARRQLAQPFPVTFYVAGPFPGLRALWLWLRDHAPATRLWRDRRTDLFAGPLDVLAVECPGPVAQTILFDRVQTRFPDLDYYDADIPLPLRYAAAFGVFPLARCHVTAQGSGLAVDGEPPEPARLLAIYPLDDPWDLDPPRPPLRILTLYPDTDPAVRPPTCLHIARDDPRHGRLDLPLDPPDLLLTAVHSALGRHDPDIVLTRYGDTWLFPLLLDIQRQTGAAYFNPNRDPDRRPQRRRAHSYHTYGQVVHRGQQVHLFGRWHIDIGNAMMYEQYGLPGVLEQARVTALPVQEVARKSPGAGITAMQMLTALRRDILVPHQKQQAERFKSALDLIHADRGGLVYQPLIGLHQDVAEIDFTSMYPSIMVRFNISPEVTSDGMKHEIGDMTAAGCPPAPLSAPELASRILPPASPDGLIPATLRPLLAKRIAMKEQLAALHPLDCRYRPLKARAAALKWLLVVCFGYLGYKNARFGRIEGHEAVTAYGREMLLRAKEAAEDHGYTVLHMYVDGLWIRHPTDTAGGLAAVMAEITRRTDLPIALEGIYRWVAFLPSRMDERVPVANRYFGVFDDGSFKVRGIEARRHDTPPFIAATQMRLLEQLAAVTDPAVALPAVVRWLGDQLADLRAGRVPPAELLVSHRLSRELGDYRARPPGARAAARLVAAGKPQPPGRRVRFIYTRGEPGVYAWGDPQPLDPARIDLARYEDLLLRAAANLLQPFIDEPSLRAWATGQAHQLRLPFPRRAPSRRTKRE